MKLCRFLDAMQQPRVGLVGPENSILDLTARGVKDLTTLLSAEDFLVQLGQWARQDLPRLALSDHKLLPPLEQHEVWAAGVTYLRSKKARMEESDFSASAYDRVYEAERPELFFKALPEKVVAPGDPVGIRSDARWNVPEPELALVLDQRGRIVGYTIGNDMSSRDIEGENVLYLPQAKIYDRSCTVGPFIAVGASEAEARTWSIHLEITRQERSVFTGETSVGQIKRSFDSLAKFLFQSQSFPRGAILLTGTGIVPPDTFTLQPGDVVRIEVSGIGVLTNPVVRV